MLKIPAIRKYLVKLNCHFNVFPRYYVFQSGSFPLFLMYFLFLPYLGFLLFLSENCQFMLFLEKLFHVHFHYVGINFSIVLDSSNL